jgi:hypothetical protein
MEAQVVATIDSSVKGHLQAYAASFDEQLNSKLHQTVIMLETKNEERNNIFRAEHQNFVKEFHETQEEQRTVNNDLKAMIRQLILNSTQSEIVFSDNTSCTQIHENQNDLSSAHTHE